MPTKTFFNLPKDKQARLLEAARIEFSRTSLSEASIANIVKHAEIPRGSFYQYFEDKEDLFYYYFSCIKKDNKKMFLNAIKVHDGDFISAFEDYFVQTVDLLLEEKNQQFFKNMFLRMDYRASRKITPDLIKSRQEKHADMQKKFIQLIDMELLNIENEEESEMLMRLLMTIMFQTIGDGFSADLSKEQIIQNFNLKMKWIKNGVYRK
ncbi:TetR/AcrR family transcriptional regulator [Isobaculum melis]|uniref:DNA-binding transcriptional regulator, AcrR family n=1 Tax=Isobaculum melis TaxID=142588 RepID=A0A1H9SXA7_9LACT|nr:TetR family transcriptional regulator [Isobaculum melis]SER89013.1 DNA-binding transcriptional regulator, AcrR family [Isobaculum melis]